MNAKVLGVLLAAGISVGASAGNVWWVDKATGTDGDGRGKSDSTAFLTIQAAVNAAQSGDEIRVKPGVYDEGGGYYNNWNNRVLIQSKVLKIVSTGGKDVTHIVGGKNIRCVCMANAKGSVVEGFTIRDGEATYSQSGTDTVNGSGAGVLGISASKTYATANGCIVDCVVSNCVAVRGGGMRGLTAVRCWITENDASNSGPAGRKCDFVNCLITRNYTTQCIYDGCKAVNCTIVDNMKGAQSCTLFNSVLHNNSNGTVDERNLYPGTLLNHCVTRVDGYDAFKDTPQPVDTITNSLPYQFIAPLYDDFRVLKGSETEFAGDASLISSAGIVVPEGVDLFKDLNGKTIPSSGVIAAGCIQTVVAPQGGGIVFDNRRNILSRGKMALAKHLYAFAETWPTQFTVQAVNKGNPAIFSFKVGEAYVFPTMDDTIHIVPPATADMVTTCGVQAATATYYVDPVKGSDSTSNGADPETPYLTLKAVIAKCDVNLGRVVRAAEGDYKLGETSAGGVSNRIYMSSYGIRVLGAGAGKSIIWGAPDPATGGMGTHATRCVYSESTRACVQGFTLRDGYAVGTSTGDDASQRGGGVYRSASGKFDTSLHILDCVITNCWAYRGGAGYAGSYERCHITGCGANNGVMRYAQLLSCVVDNLPCSELTYKGANNVYGRAYNTTFIGRNTSEYVINKSSDAVTNCIIMTTKELTSLPAAGTFAWNVANCVASVTKADPKLVDVAGGDYRPMHYYRRKRLYEVSPVFGAGVWYDLPAINMTDFEGRPFNLVAGKPAAGAFQWPHSVYETPGLIVTFK